MTLGEFRWIANLGIAALGAGSVVPVALSLWLHTNPVARSVMVKLPLSAVGIGDS